MLNEREPHVVIPPPSIARLTVSVGVTAGVGEVTC